MVEPKSLYEWKVSNPLVPPLEQDASDLAEEIKNNPLTVDPVSGHEIEFDPKGKFSGIRVYTVSPDSPVLTYYWQSRCWEIEFVGFVSVVDRGQAPESSGDED